MNNFTNGFWRAFDGSVTADGKQVAICHTHDAGLIAAAGTSATALAAQGYDGQRCIEMLPEIMERLEEIDRDVRIPSDYASREARPVFQMIQSTVRDLLDACRAASLTPKPAGQEEK